MEVWVVAIAKQNRGYCNEHNPHFVYHPFLVTPKALGILIAGMIRYGLYIVEAIAVLVLVRMARGRTGRRLHVRRFVEFAQHRTRAVVCVGLLTLALRAMLLPVMPPRLPAIADEHSYVLSGETFALGRVTNPPHPMADYFESPHVLQHPTYMSMYFPAQGLFLAAGKVVTGDPWFGVWLSVGLMCAALTWMLQGWLPPAWALLGGLIAVMRLGLFGYWMNSFFGGAVPALAGALVLGAAPRLLRRQRPLDAIVLACGVAILLNSRPYEGAFLCVPVAIALLWSRKLELRTVAAIALVLIVAFAATGYYNWRVTGSPLRMPQALRVSQVMTAPYLIWQSAKPEPSYTNDALRVFHTETEMNDYLATRGLRGWLLTTMIKIRDGWLFYLGPVLTLPLVFLPRVLKDRRIRLLLIVAAVCIAGQLTGVWFYAHYAAPATAVLYAVLIQCMRHMRVSNPTLVRGIPIVCVLMVVLRLAEQPIPLFHPLDFPMTWCFTRPGGIERANIVQRLHAEGGKHLILVRWKPGDNPYEQWVYNAPDIDKSEIVWAWETEHPEKLLDYYKDRQVWLMRVVLQGEPPLTRYRGRL